MNLPKVDKLRLNYMFALYDSFGANKFTYLLIGK